MSTQREMVCISCPIGCRLSVTAEGDDVRVRGNRCKRGEIYAREELLAPTRMVTTTCRIQDGQAARVPVRTTTPLPTGFIDELLQHLHTTTLQAPLPIGSVVIPDVNDTGISVITSHSVAARDQSSEPDTH